MFYICRTVTFVDEERWVCRYQRKQRIRRVYCITNHWFVVLTWYQFHKYVL